MYAPCWTPPSQGPRSRPGPGWPRGGPRSGQAGLWPAAGGWAAEGPDSGFRRWAWRPGWRSHPPGQDPAPRETSQPPVLRPERLPHVACSLLWVLVSARPLLAPVDHPHVLEPPGSGPGHHCLVCACPFLCVRRPVHLPPGHELSGLRLGRAPQGTTGQRPRCGRCWSWAPEPRLTAEPGSPAQVLWGPRNTHASC